MYAREKAPSLIDPAGPTISLIPSEQVFVMAAALNVCGYDEGLENSAPIRKHVRDEINQALAQSEDARTKRDALCLYIAQHRMTGSERDISQYISLSLYLTPPPELEVTVDLTEMPPDSTQVVEVLPALRAFAAAVDLRGIWLTSHHLYDEEIDKLHDPISKMIVNANLYLKMPASTYDGRRFIVIIEPQLSPAVVNARQNSSMDGKRSSGLTAKARTNTACSHSGTVSLPLRRPSTWMFVVPRSKLRVRTRGSAWPSYGRTPQRLK